MGAGLSRIGRAAAFLCLLVWASAIAAPAWALCNTRNGAVDDQPSPPPADETNVDSSRGQTIDSSANHDDRLNDQTLKLDLSKDIVSLVGFGGKLTSGVSVLGVRMENIPGFDAKKYCNAIQPILYKPTIEKLPNGSLRAEVEDGRFQVEFDPARLKSAWIADADTAQQFFWIFPAIYGRSPKTGKPWSLTDSYDGMFKSTKLGSVRRRWIAEAYLNLSMRLYREQGLSDGYPKGWRPSRTDLEAAIGSQLGRTCDQTSSDLICLASTLIEINEAAPPGNLISAEAFRAGDALLENSGVSAGIRQLDFGTGNQQASQLVGKLLPSTLGRYKLGYGYRRAIRAWDIASLNWWYAKVGPSANEELSRDEAKKLLLASHAAYLESAVGQWTARVAAAYPNWNPQEREALELVSIDLENVSGFQMHMIKGAQNTCDVLNDSTVVTSGRSNRGVTTSQLQRVKNGATLLHKLPQMSDLDWRCLETQ